MSDLKSKQDDKRDIFLWLTLLLSVTLHGYSIWTDKYVNTYYTTTVGSMLQSWHNFFFVSLDSAGSVTVDKPPLTFWIQALSAKIFGLQGWSVILPQAIAGVLSVLLVYILIKPTFSVVAARIAAIVMAGTPIAVAVGRTNNIDSMLVFTLLLAAWLLMKGVRNGSSKSVIGAFAVVGLAFNMKMLQAYMVLPAFYFFYSIAFKMPWKKKAAVAAGATAIMLMISLAWAIIVDSVPAGKRPFIGSSTTNSVMELALGYNGVSRLTGEQGPGGAGSNGEGNGAVGDGNNRSDGNFPRRDGSGIQGDSGFPGGGGGYGNQGGMFGTGSKGVFRLFQSELSDQASWLIPFAAFGAFALLMGLNVRQLTLKHKETLFWLAWLLPMMGFFSIAGFFHPYYLIMIAPAIAALVGAGWSELWGMYRTSGDWKSVLLPIAMASTTTSAWYIMHPSDAIIGKGWSAGILAGGIMIGLLLLVNRWMKVSWARWAAFAGLSIMLIGPLYWAATPITYGQNSMLPQAGPSASFGQGLGLGLGRGGGMGSGPGRTDSSGGVNEKLLAYLHQHSTGETYLMAAQSYGTAAPFIVDANEKVITLNGFSGSDQVYTTDELQALVSSGRVKFFLIGGGMGGGPGGERGNSGLTQWIQENGTGIPASEWQSAASTDNGNNQRGMGWPIESLTLYEVKTK